MKRKRCDVSAVPFEEVPWVHAQVSADRAQEEEVETVVPDSSVAADKNPPPGNQRPPPCRGPT